MRETPRKDGEPNRDPISGAPGAHPVGTGVGAAAGGRAGGGAAAPVMAPIGTAVGAAIGAIAGGLAGKGIAESIDPTVEDRYWKDNYSARSYVPSGASYNDYGPAYRYGYETYPKYHGKTFDEIESELSSDWDRAKGTSRLTWN